MNVSKENILSNISEEDIMHHYLSRYHTGSKESLRAGKNISNPFLGAPQKTPSFNIFQAKGSDKWLFNDFATGDKGDCFELVQKLFNLSFPEALHRIASDFLIMDNKFVNHVPKSTPIPVDNNTNIEFKDFSEQELLYWKKYGIDQGTLNLFSVKSICNYKSISKDNKSYTVMSRSDYPIFAYVRPTWTKVYKPLDSKYKFQYLGQKDQDFIFGSDQLPSQGENVFITGGEKDVMSLTAHGYSAITLNSETANLPPDIADTLKSRFKNVIVLYDNDATGLKHSETLALVHGFYRIVLHDIPNNGKDISDFFLNGGTKDDLNALIIEATSKPNPIKSDPNKSIFNAVELLALGNNEQKFLMGPILPQKGTAVLAGKPDTGKSQFVRQLCVHVALGITEFLGFPLNPVHKRAIYVATEDNSDNTCFLLNKQLKGLDAFAKESLRFMFADTMDQSEIIEKLDSDLKEFPSDLVIIDSFGDIFTGGDSNNNMAMRNTVKLFDKIAKEHNCLVIFVHHINKGAYKQAPAQEHIQGGSGLVQKVRLAIQLSEGDGDIRYFTVVKGNYCPKEYKQNSLELIFSEETFLFENTGKVIPTNEIGSQPVTDKKEDKFDDLKELSKNIFQDQVLTYSKFVSKYCEITKKSTATAKRVHRELKDLEIIVDCNGAYRLALQEEPSLSFLDDEAPF